MRNASILVVMVSACASSPGAPVGPTEQPDAPTIGPDAPKGDTPDAPLSGIDACFPPPADLTKPHPNYGQFQPITNSQCTGTNHQQISGVERVVFLGDSVTTGTPPTLPTAFYRTLVANDMRSKFGPLINVQDCSKWGAHNSDLLEGDDQIHHCFSEVENRRTLVVMTMGGNDMSAIAKAATDGDTAVQTMAKVDESLHAFEDAVTWLQDPAHFPNGSYIVFSNIYEFTDATGDLASCPAAALAGFGAVAAPQMTPAYLHVAEQYMRIAVERQIDMVFSLENFCGHGFHADDPSSVCYRGPNTDVWFDLTCVHPNPKGHAALARLFTTTISE
jgi:GDSL-like Lipase/Acylhydrolase family